MSGWKKLAAASAAGGEALNVEDVFSTYLYTGNSSTQTITNGIDLSGEDGLVWIKPRTQNNYHYLFDTQATGATSALLLPLRSPPSATTTALTSFNSDGFSLGSNAGVNGTHDMVSWTFRKAPKFFDIVTYTGNGTNGRTISHNLGSAPGCIIVKDISYNSDWKVYHRGIGATKWLELNNNTSVQTGNENWYDTAPTSSVFTVGVQANNNGSNFIAYLFAHNDGDGEFGPDGDLDAIKCGSYTGNNSGVEIDLGFEPQWFMCKKTNGGSDWQIFDTMRGMHFDTTTQSVRLSPNTSGAETSQLIIGPSPTGVSIPDASDSVNINGGTYIYIAIRRGPMAVPESATDVFKALAYTGNNSSQDLDVGFPIDTAFIQNRTKNYTYNNWVIDRIRDPGKQLYTDLSSATASDGSYKHLDNNFGLEFTGSGNLNGVYGGTAVPYIGYFYREAAGFFDVVPYTGNGGIGANATQTITHNLGVAPEMIFVKARAGSYAASSSFMVYHSGVVATKALYLNADYVPSTGNWWNNTAPTDTNFSVGDNYQTNENATTFIAYLFATLPGISKVGSYTGNGSSQTIDCGFTSGASFIMIKRTDSTGNWYQWDTERGIVSGNDPHLGYNISGPTAENSSYDSVDPNNSGFNVVQNSGTNINVNNATYIFHAIA